MRILFATDHAGYALKEVLVPYVRDELGYEVEDMGAHSPSPDDDYPTFVLPAARAVADAGGTLRAVILGGSGQGEAMAANRIRGVRAAVYYGGPHEIITLSREHNDANILSLGARLLSIQEAKDAVKEWLSTDASKDARHIRRQEMLDALT